MKNLLVLALVISSTVAFAKGHKVTKEQKEAAAKACEASKADKKAYKSCVKEELKKASEATTTEAAKTEAAPAAATEPAKK
jgi:hypothetical protein